MGAKMLGSIITAGVLLLFATAVSTTYAGTEPELRNNVKEEPNCFLCQIIVVSVEMAIISNNVTMDHIVESWAMFVTLLARKTPVLWPHATPWWRSTWRSSSTWSWCSSCNHLKSAQL